MARFTSKDELGGYKLVLKPRSKPGEHIEPWCIHTDKDGTVTIRGAAVDRLAELEDEAEQERRDLWQKIMREGIAGGHRTRKSSMKRQ